MPVPAAAIRRVALPFAGTDTWLVVSARVDPLLFLYAIFTVKSASRPFGFLTSTVEYGSSRLAHRLSTAVPSFSGRAVADEVAVGVER